MTHGIHHLAKTELMGEGYCQVVRLDAGGVMHEHVLLPTTLPSAPLSCSFTFAAPPSHLKSLGSAPVWLNDRAAAYSLSHLTTGRNDTVGREEWRQLGQRWQAEQHADADAKELQPP